MSWGPLPDYSGSQPDGPAMKRYILNTKKGLLGDSATEWWTEEDWSKWDAEVVKMKKDGTYLQPITYTVDLVENLNYDNRTYGQLSSARLEFLDFTNN